MCGISFFCSAKYNAAQDLEKSLLALHHRGPDASGVYFTKIANYYIGLGHTRLSILDLSSAANQPLNLGGGVIIAYNGEIYNLANLRQQLQSRGYSFRGHSDTEIVLLLYTEFGPASFAMLSGMFAFVIIDENLQKIYIVRDSLGIKPIYLYIKDKSIFASSEIRGLKTFTDLNFEINSSDVFEFFNQGFLYEPDTGYQNVKKLLPGHYLEYNLATEIYEIHRFQNIYDLRVNNGLEQDLEQAIAQQLVADVPVATFFSGGMDSSLIASFAKNNDLFFAKYCDDPAANIDSIFSNKIAKYFKKDLVIAEINSPQESVEELMFGVDFVARNTEELISDYSFWPTFQIAQAAREKGYKVMLSGMGGDEIFGGYPRYLVLKHHNLLHYLNPLLYFFLRKNFFPQKFDKKFERLVSYSNEKHWPSAYSRLLGYFSADDLNHFFSDFQVRNEGYCRKLNKISQNYNNHADKFKLAQYFDLQGFLTHNLMVADKASMLASVELRVPLLDDLLLAHGLGSPTSLLIKGRELKCSLKKVLQKYLPLDLVNRPKTGFNPPLDNLINKIGPQKLKKFFPAIGEFIDIDWANNLVDQHFAQQANYTYKLWQLLYFSRWLQFNV